MTAVLRDAYGPSVSESVFGRIPIAIASDRQDSVALAAAWLERCLAKRPTPGRFWEKARAS